MEQEPKHASPGCRQLLQRATADPALPLARFLLDETHLLALMVEHGEGRAGLKVPSLAFRHSLRGEGPVRSWR